MTQFTIYMLECPKGRHYVGCTSRSPEHRLRTIEMGVREWPGDARASIGDALKRFGRHRFTIRVLAVTDDADGAAAIETQMIALHGAAQPAGYNSMKTSHYRASRLRKAA